MTKEQWFWIGYVDGAVLKKEATAREAEHRYPDLSFEHERAYQQGTVDGALGDSWRLQWAAHMLVGDVGN